MGPFLLKVCLKFSEKLNKLNTHIVLIQLSVILFLMVILMWAWLSIVVVVLGGVG